MRPASPSRRLQAPTITFDAVRRSGSARRSQHVWQAPFDYGKSPRYHGSIGYRIMASDHVVLIIIQYEMIVRDAVEAVEAKIFSLARCVENVDAAAALQDLSSAIAGNPTFDPERDRARLKSKCIAWHDRNKHELMQLPSHYLYCALWSCFKRRHPSLRPLLFARIFWIAAQTMRV